MTFSSSVSYHGILRKPVARAPAAGIKQLVSTGSSSRESIPNLRRRPTATELQEKSFNESINILSRPENGYSNIASIKMDPSQPWSQSDDVFYALLSVKGMSHVHTALQAVLKNPLALVSSLWHGSVCASDADLVHGNLRPSHVILDCQHHDAPEARAPSRHRELGQGWQVSRGHLTAA